MSNDTGIIRELAVQLAQAAADPIQQQRLKEWKAINALRPIRPMFTIDQICWKQMNYNDELTLRCEEPFARALEDRLRKQLYRWNHLRDDRVFEPFVTVPKVIHGGNYNLSISENILETTAEAGCVSHQYKDQLADEEAVEKLDVLDIEYDADATEKNLAMTRELLGDTLPIKLTGTSIGFALWDRISMFRGVDNILMDIIDRPEFLHRTIAKFVTLSTRMVDQLEAQGLLEPAQSLVHCAGGWTDELPREGFDPEKPRTQDCWTSGMAQLFSTVSPTMHDEFEIQHQKPLYDRFGLVNYGCCEPLDRKIDMIRQLKTVRMVSVSPWAHEERSAEGLGQDYIYLRKPNPAHLATPLDEDLVRTHLQTSLDVCEKYGAIPEFALKDISTVNNDPRNLWRWCEIAREVTGG